MSPWFFSLISFVIAIPLVSVDLCGVRVRLWFPNIGLPMASGFIPILESMFRRSVDYKAMYEGRLIRIRHCLSLFISNIDSLNTSLY